MPAPRSIAISWMLTALAAIALAPSSGAAQAPYRIPLVVHVAVQAGAPVADEAFIDSQLAFANEIFLPLGFELVMSARRALPARHAELHTRADRDALARYVKRGALNWFVVGKLMDVDERGRERRGVHWHERRPPHRHFVVVSKIAGPHVLAHELGHFFGNPAHSEVAGNLMSYQRTDGPPALDPAQQAQVKQTLAELLRTRELVPLPAPSH